MFDHSRAFITSNHTHALRTHTTHIDLHTANHHMHATSTPSPSRIACPPIRYQPPIVGGQDARPSCCCVDITHVTHVCTPMTSILCDATLLPHTPRLVVVCVCVHVTRMSVCVVVVVSAAHSMSLVCVCVAMLHGCECCPCHKVWSCHPHG